MATLDLSPAQWIWLPGERTLPNTFALLRRSFHLEDLPQAAVGWIASDSRYRLFVNGKRVQWGPAPFDPRHAEADPLDILPFLIPGENVIGVEVLFYGHGDGTWPFGKPGLLFFLTMDGLAIVSDEEWRCIVDRGHRPGQFKRWYLRALQEDFDARRHPLGWTEPGFPVGDWLPAKPTGAPAHRSAFSARYSDYLNEVWMGDPSSSSLIERTIPMLRDEWTPASLEHRGTVTWRRSPDDWFEFRIPEALSVSRDEGPLHEVAAARQGMGTYLTYALPEGVVGWPAFTIDAPEGTVVEVMVHEAHDPLNHPWMDSHFYCWSRFTCREGRNRFECFDFEALKWLQLHVHGNLSDATISEVGVRRRLYPWPYCAEHEVDDDGLQTLFDAAVNTLHNSAQETCVDGMGRERQQYSGDGGHQLHPVRQVFGETRLPARFLRTYGQGQLLDGVFADSWPAYDRLARLWERNVDASSWGPLLDHSVGFVFDHHHHYMQTGDLGPFEANESKLMRFVRYLESIVGDDGLLPVENLGQNAVWIDHEAFETQADKKCAFNLYAAAMLLHAWPDDRHHPFGNRLLAAAKEKFLSDGVFCYREDGRTDDRSLSTAILFDLVDDPSSMVDLLARPGPNVGQSYPPNLVWNYWALIKAGRIQEILDDLRERWVPMRSVRENNTIQEFWQVHDDRPNLMSHCPIAPLVVLHQGILGLQPITPGYGEMSVRPQLGDLRRVCVVSHTPKGPVTLRADEEGLRIVTPPDARAHVTWNGTVHQSSGELFLPRG